MLRFPVQSPAQNSSNGEVKTRLVRAVSRLVLKSPHRDCTTSLFSLHQHLTVLWVRKISLIANLNISCFNLCLLSLHLLPHVTLQSLVLSSQYPPHRWQVAVQLFTTVSVDTDFIAFLQIFLIFPNKWCPKNEQIDLAEVALL